MRTLLAAAAALAITASYAVAETTTTGDTALRFVDQENQSEALASDFIGTPVELKDGERVGVVRNLVFDQSGRVELVVIGVGGVLRAGTKQVAVPFDAVKSEVRNNKHVVVLDTTTDALRKAPAFKSLNTRAFEQRIANWREKAAAQWADIKSRAEKAYRDAKARMTEPNQSPEEQAPK